MENLTYEQMFDATQRNDASYDGRFYVGVLSTKIYCLPSCKAKLPLKKNIVFFPSRNEAIAAGLRGCKRCKSEFYPNVAPSWLEDIVSLMRKEVNSRIEEQRLIEIAGVDISTIRRYFQSNFQTTPMAFHRKLRLAHARELIEEGMDYLSAAYECGFESASGFRDAFEKVYGLPPGAYYARTAYRV